MRARGRRFWWRSGAPGIQTASGRQTGRAPPGPGTAPNGRDCTAGGVGAWAAPMPFLVERTSLCCWGLDPRLHANPRAPGGRGTSGNAGEGHRRSGWRVLLFRRAEGDSPGERGPGVVVAYTTEHVVVLRGFSPDGAGQWMWGANCHSTPRRLCRGPSHGGSGTAKAGTA